MMNEIQRALVAIDFSDKSDSVIQWAISIAKAHQAELILVHVSNSDPDFVGYGPGPQTVRDQVAHDLNDEHRQLQQLAESITAQQVVVQTHCLQGTVVETILEKAKTDKADLIIVGSHGHGGLFRAVLGSISEGIVRHSPSPVVVVPTRG